MMLSLCALRPSQLRELHCGGGIILTRSSNKVTTRTTAGISTRVGMIPSIPRPFIEAVARSLNQLLQGVVVHKVFTTCFAEVCLLKEAQFCFHHHASEDESPNVLVRSIAQLTFAAPGFVRRHQHPFSSSRFPVLRAMAAGCFWSPWRRTCFRQRCLPRCLVGDIRSFAKQRRKNSGSASSPLHSAGRGIQVLRLLGSQR